MPIAFVNSGRTPYHPRHYHLMAAGLAKAGLDVMVVGPPDGQSHPPGPVPVVLVDGIGRGRLGRIVSGPLMLRHVLRTRPGLVQVNNLDLLLWAALARRRSGIPMIYDANEDYAAYMLIKEWLPRPLRKPLSRLVGYLEPRLAARLDAMTVADPATADRFRRAGLSPLVVHNFPWLSPDAADVEPVHDVTHHGSLAGYTRRNVIETAAELARREIEVKWCLATRGSSPAQQQELEDDIDGRGLRGQFTLLYDRPFPEMAELVARTRIGFVPLPDLQKFRHNIPRKLFEFLAAGRPVVASDLPPTRRLVGDHDCCVLVPPGDAKGYADAIAGLLADPEAARAAGARGRQLILERLNAETELEPYVALCRSLVR
jgi:glycosyltransferase involved in cell wall biosynthesis